MISGTLMIGINSLVKGNPERFFYPLPCEDTVKRQTLDLAQLPEL